MPVCRIARRSLLLAWLGCSRWTQPTLAADSVSNRPTGGYQLSGTTLSGASFSLSALQGRYVLISFFSTESAISRKEMPLLRQFVADNRLKGFALVGVGTDGRLADLRQYDAVLNATQDNQALFPILWRLAPGHYDNFGTLATVPSHFVLDPHGKLVLERQGPMRPEDWDALWTSLQKPH